MWFQVDKEALDDWRIRRLAREMGISVGDAFLLCCRVWCRLYERGGGAMPAEEVDAVGDLYLADTMVRVGLAVVTPDGLRIKGDERAEKFAELRIRQKAKSERAHKARYGNGADKELPPGMPPGCPGISLLDLSLSSESDQSAQSDASQSGVTIARGTAILERHRKRDEAAFIAAESWLGWYNDRFKRRLGMTKALVKQVGAILAQGFSEKPDMRGVALYLRSQWEGDQAMARFLVPPTMLRPTRFEERLALAREWDPKIWAGDERVAACMPAPRIALSVKSDGPAPEFVDRNEIAQLALKLLKGKP